MHIYKLMIIYSERVFNLLMTYNSMHKDFKLRKKNFLCQLHFFLVYQVLASIQVKPELDRNVQVV